MFAPVKNHNVLNLLGILGIFVAFVSTVTINFLSGSGAKIFINPIYILSAKYGLSFTPASYTFMLWNVIYAWLGLAILFYLVSLFKGSPMGKLYLNPVVVSPWYSYFFITNLLYNISWAFTWDREQLVGSAILLFLLAKTNIFCVGILARNIAYDSHQMRDENPKVYWLYVILAMNGQAVYATWCVIASLLNFGSCLKYVAELDESRVSQICLGTLLAAVIVYFILENIVLDNYIRLLLTPYLVVIWASIGILVKMDSKDDTPEVARQLTKAILGVGCVCMALRVVIVTLRQLKRPLGRSGMSEISDKPLP